MMRCPACSAANADSARWCGQCFAALGETAATAAPTEPARPAEGAHAPEDAPSTATQEGRPTPSPEHPTTTAGIRRTAEGLEWACVACETLNPIEVSTCRVCGTSFTARFSTTPRPVDVDWDAARLRSVLLPGLGHVAAGRAGQGVGRAFLFVIWVVGAVLVMLGAGSRGTLIAAPLVLGAVVVHLGSLHDLRALERGGRELLAGRTLLWLVIGVTVALMVTTILGISTTAPG